MRFRLLGTTLIISALGIGMTAMLRTFGRLPDSARARGVASHGVDSAEWYDSLVEAGGQWFAEYNCLHCHSLVGYGGQMGPELLGLSERRSSAWLVRHFLSPDSVSPHTLMPAFGPDSIALALTFFLQTLRSTADAAPIIHPFREGEQSAIPRPVIDPASLTNGRRLLVRLSASDSVMAVGLEHRHRAKDVFVVRREWYGPRLDQSGWRRYMDERVFLSGEALTVDSVDTVMDGIVQNVRRVGDAVTVRAVRPGAPRGWSETRRLPRLLYSSWDDIVPITWLTAGDSIGYWVLGMHGGAHPRIAKAVTVGTSDTLLVRVVTAGTREPDRWIRIVEGRPVFTSYGDRPDVGGRLVTADRATFRWWLAALSTMSRAGWVHGHGPSLLDTWLRH